MCWNTHLELAWKIPADGMITYQPPVGGAEEVVGGGGGGAWLVVVMVVGGGGGGWVVVPVGPIEVGGGVPSALTVQEPVPAAVAQTSANPLA